jgi:hypothetical protein
MTYSAPMRSGVHIDSNDGGPHFQGVRPSPPPPVATAGHWGYSRIGVSASTTDSVSVPAEDLSPDGVHSTQPYPRSVHGGRGGAAYGHTVTRARSAEATTRARR